MCSGNAFQMLLSSFAFSTHLDLLEERSRQAELSEEELRKRTWNCDETAFATDTASKKVLSRRGERNVHETGGGSGREYVTVLGCGAADGTKLPPYVVYKSKNLWSSWTMGGRCRYTLHRIRVRILTKEVSNST